MPRTYRYLFAALVITSCAVDTQHVIDVDTSAPIATSTVIDTTAVPIPEPATTLQPPVDVVAESAPEPEPESEPVTTTSPPRQPSSRTARLEPCGGDLPPCAVVAKESGGDYTAVNPRGCNGRGCFGKYQFDPRTWNGYGGYENPAEAPAEVQDEKARQVWAGGAGCSQWSGPNWNGCQFIER